MPLERCQRQGADGWRYGSSGFCYVGPGAKERASRQGRAIEVSKGLTDENAGAMLAAEGSTEDGPSNPRTRLDSDVPSAAREQQATLFPQRTISYLGDVGRILFQAAAKTNSTTSWVQVFRLGEFQHPQGEFLVDDAFLASIVQSFATMLARGAEIPVDYEHGSAAAGVPPEAARAAGWVKDLDHRQGTGLWALVEWTDDAVEFIKAREYRYISPEFHPEYHDEVGNDMGPTLLAVGLVNRPHLKGMEAVSLKEQRMNVESTEPVAAAGVKREITEYDTSAVAAQEAPGAGEDLHELIKHAFDRLDALDDKINALGAGGLGKGVEAEEEDQVYGMSDKPDESTAIEPGVPEEVTALMAEMNQRLQSVEAENKALRAERDSVAAKADIDLAFRQGRITRAQVEPLMSLRLKDEAAFHAIVLASPEGSVTASEVEHGVFGEKPSEHDIDLIGVIKAKAEEDGVSFSQAYREVTREQPEMVAEYTRKTRDTNGHVGRIVGGN